MRFSADSRDEFIHLFLEALDCPRALTVSILYRSGEHKELTALEFNPTDYNTMIDARDSLAATSFLSKAKFLKTGNDLRDVALKKFWEAEARCKDANHRILWPGSYDPVVAQGLSLARQKIHDILGDLRQNIEPLLDACNWGPGASLNVKRREATAPKKFRDDHGVTPDFYAFCKPWFSAAYPLWDAISEPQVSDANKVITVPKNAKTDRTIAIEPGLNLWFQKGVGVIIRRRLKGFAGIDLNTQERNQSLAKEASRGDTIATIDFSAASDTLSTSLIWELLPTDWYSFLDVLRSKFALLDGQKTYYNKFSSMGNGYTFELESLVFLSLAHAACHLSSCNYDEFSSISIFGDDLIIPSKALNIFHHLCDFCGLKINDQKSFSTGYYRESCGSHYWNGVDIKPLFLKEDLNATEEVLKCANNLRRLAHRRNGYCGCDSRLLDVYTFLSHAISFVPRISEGFGDAGLIENIDHPAVVFRPAKHGMEGYVVRVLLFRPAMVITDHHGLFLARLKECGGASEISYGNQSPLPGRGRKIRKNLLMPRWYDLGEWL
jgi:hypothetical protein